MGKVWTRNQPSSESNRQLLSKKKSNVWTRSDPTQKTPVEPTATSSTHFEGSDDPAAKRRRLASKGRLSRESSYTLTERPTSFIAEVQPIATAKAKLTQQQILVKEAAELRSRIAEEEAKIAAAKDVVKTKQEEQAAVERLKRETQELRKSRLDAGFAEAFRATRELAASQKAPKVKAADQTEVCRVLNAKSDHEVLRLKPGTDRVLIKKTYKSMMLALHPDKCKADGATDAFQRLVQSYQNIIKY